MKLHRSAHPVAGFTLVELLIGISLSLMVMGAVLSSYVFLARNFTRSLGVNSSNQPTLESQGRRTLAYFTQDVRMGSAVSGISATEMTLTLPSSTGSTRLITYYYNSTANSVSIYGITATPKSLTRIDRNTSTALTLHNDLLTFSFSYYDTTGNLITSYTNYAIGLKQVSFSLTSQAGSAINGTLTPVFQIASPRLVLRNKTVLY